MTLHPCEGCSRPLARGSLAGHRAKCSPYQDWSKTQPFKCQCGQGFSTERSLQSHKNNCDKSETIRKPLGQRKCMCGESVRSFPEHRPHCPGPKNPELISIPTEVPANTCACGRAFTVNSTLVRHRYGCPVWFVFQKTLLVKCEGCGEGFFDQFGKRVHAQRCPSWQTWRAEKDTEEKTYPCPSCGELMRGSPLGLHVNSCPGPWSKQDWQTWREQAKAGRFGVRLRDQTGLEKGKDFVECRLCGKHYRQLSGHLVSKHGMTVREYKFKIEAETCATEVTAQRQETCLETYGFDHPRKVSEITERAEAKRNATCLERFGSTSPFSAGFISPPKKNGLELDVEMMSPPNVVYSGDHSYWICCRRADGKMINRNPDFVVYRSEDLARVQAGEPIKTVRTGYVIEVLGDFFHGKKRMGLTSEDYVAVRTAEYASVGVKSLFLWESEVYNETEKIRERISAFVKELEAKSPNPSIPL